MTRERGSAPNRSRRTFLFGVGAFAAALFIPRTAKLIFPVENSPLLLPSSPLSGGNRTGNRRVYMWLVKDKKEEGGARFMEKFGSPPANSEDGSRVAVLCNENAYRKYDMGLKSSTDADTGEAFFYDDSKTFHSWGGPGCMDEQVHVLPKETAEAFAKRAFEAERTQSDFNWAENPKHPWPKVPKAGEVVKLPSKNARISIPLTPHVVTGSEDDKPVVCKLKGYDTIYNDGKSLVVKRSMIVP